MITNIAIIIIPNLSESKIESSLPASVKGRNLPVLTTQKQSDFDSIAVACRCENFKKPIVSEVSSLTIIAHPADESNADWSDMRYSDLSAMKYEELKQFIQNLGE